jgi:hypothetical protein
MEPTSPNDRVWTLTRGRFEILQRSSLLPYYHDLIFIAGKPPGPEVKRREFVALSARASTGRKEPYMTGAVSYAAKATDERVTCLRIFADASGETHMQDINIALQPRKLFKDTYGAVDYASSPRMVWLTGEVEFETSDGNIRRLAAGSVVLAEDTTGKGHISRHPAEGQLVVHIDLA